MQVTLIERETRAHCRTELLYAQEKAGKSITRLLQLNIPIRVAKATRAGALIVMAAAAASGNSAAFAIAYKIYEGATKTLDALKISQKALITKAYFDLAQGIYRARNAVSGVWKKQKRSKAELQVLTGSLSLPSIPHVAVRPKNKSDEYPEYELEDDFQEKQALQVSWKLRWQHSSTRSEWNKKQEWQSFRGCSATLVPEDGQNKFRARLSEAKFYSKSWFFF